ncbi:MAG TPA: CPBP family intramembrane metalloprotease [Candidatus Woesebacteria bacterium]|nr:CPBP family intramembrane metalloprotease [Candidatus Woesebacteria bacterium]
MAKDASINQKMLNTWAIAIIIWSVYRYYFKTDLPLWFDEFIAKPIVFLVPVYYFIIKYENGKILQAIDFKFKKVNDWLFGIGAGIFVLVMGLIVNYVDTQTIIPTITSTTLFLIVVAFASSFTEEILSRGFVLKRLYAESNNVFSSVFFASFLFFIMHVPILFTNPQLHGSILLQVMATDFLLSFGVSLAYLQRKNVIVAIIIHAFYNLAIYLML